MPRKIILRSDFSSNDFDEFAPMLKNANIEVNLMETGLFHGAGKTVASSNIFVSQFSINKKVLQLGASLPGHITFIVWDPTKYFHWRNHELKNGMLGLLWNNEHRSITNANLVGLPITINEQYFLECCQFKGYSNLIRKLKNSDLLIVNESKLIKIRQLVLRITQSKSLNDKMVFEMMEIQLVDLLFDALVETLFEIPQPDFSTSKFSNTLDYIHENLNEITSVHQVSKKLNIPERTLRHYFQKSFDVSPKSYIQKLRLHEVRKKLKNNLQNDMKVIDAAGEYNFWHMGQFTRDYKSLFGELPSNSK